MESRDSRRSVTANTRPARVTPAPTRRSCAVHARGTSAVRRFPKSLDWGGDESPDGGAGHGSGPCPPARGPRAVLTPRRDEPPRSAVVLTPHQDDPVLVVGPPLAQPGTRGVNWQSTCHPRAGQGGAASGQMDHWRTVERTFPPLSADARGVHVCHRLAACAHGSGGRMAPLACVARRSALAALSAVSVRPLPRFLCISGSQPGVLAPFLN
jgi:hypothetical protein